MKRKRERQAMGVPSGKRLAAWVELRNHFGFSHAVIQMARELSMSPDAVRVYVKRRRKRGMPHFEKWVASRFRNVFGMPPLTDVLCLEEQVTSQERMKREAA